MANRILSLAFVCAVVASCAAIPTPYGYQSDDQVPPATCRTTYSQTFDATTFTDPKEQAAITRAGDMWRAMSKGQIDMRFAFTPEGATTAGGAILRVHKADPDVVAYNAAQQKAGNEPAGWSVLGWEIGQTVHIVIDGNGITSDNLHSLVAHELGHAAGLRWPFCLAGNEDCVHSPDPHAVMAPAFSGAPELTPSDLALCRASCLCP